MTDHDLSRLPRWAQSEIERLRKDVEWWKEQACAAANERGQTNVVLRGHAHDADRGLPPDSSILFVLPEGRIEVDHGQGGGVLEVRNLDAYLSVEPSASNSIIVRARLR